MTTDHSHAHGHITYETDRKDDYLFRLSLKLLIANENGEVLVVKESGRSWWDLPGGGMDHGEDFKAAIAREGREEVNLSGDFTYKIIAVDPPLLLERSMVWQVRLIFHVNPSNMDFLIGAEADEVRFINPALLKTSDIPAERRVYAYFSVNKCWGAK